MVWARYEPAWNFDAKVVEGEGHEMVKVQKEAGHCHFLQMKNTSNHCPYGLHDSKL